jgi:hypothetical protein
VTRREARADEAFRAQQEEARLLLHQHLDVLRVAKQQQQERQQRVEYEEATHREQQEEERRLKCEQEQAQRRTVVAEFQRLREEARARRLQQEKESEARRVEEMRGLIAANRGKVEGRETTRLQKEEEKHRRLLQKQEEEAHRLELLAKLAATVPYWDAIENATSQLGHVTAAVRAQEWYVRTHSIYLSIIHLTLTPSTNTIYNNCAMLPLPRYKPEELTRGFLDLNGFGDKKIIGDARFRLAEALREAGVASSKMAQHAVQAFCPRPHLAIHGIFNKTVF